MAFDPTLPQTNAPIVSAELREAFEMASLLALS
jgi:hypothetical protein